MGGGPLRGLSDVAAAGHARGGGIARTVAYAPLCLAVAVEPAEHRHVLGVEDNASSRVRIHWQHRRAGGSSGEAQAPALVADLDAVASWLGAAAPGRPRRVHDPLGKVTAKGSCQGKRPTAPDGFIPAPEASCFVLILNASGIEGLDLAGAVKRAA